MIGRNSLKGWRALMALPVALVVVSSVACDHLPSDVEGEDLAATLDAGDLGSLGDAAGHDASADGAEDTAIADASSVDGDDGRTQEEWPCGCPREPFPVCDTATSVTYESPCVAQCAGVLDWALRPCAADCEDYCTANDLLETPRCGTDGVTYESHCALLCSPADSECAQTNACPAFFYSGRCEDLCVVEDSRRVELGGTVPAFTCTDLNTRSESHGDAFSDVVLRERVWIAYFGSCT